MSTHISEVEYIHIVLSPGVWTMAHLKNDMSKLQEIFSTLPMALAHMYFRLCLPIIGYTTSG